MFTITLSHLLAREVRLDAHEAVAIAQELIARRAGVPAAGNIQLGSDGSASCVNASGTPSVLDVAALLQGLLPPGTAVPAPLRYAIARGLGTVEAPPFDSLGAFSTALQRFEAGERREVLRGLLQRVARRPAPTPAPPPRPVSVAPVAAAVSVTPVAAVSVAPVSAAPVPAPAAPSRTNRRLAAAAAVVASFAAGFGVMQLVSEPASTSGPLSHAERVSPAPAVAVPPTVEEPKAPVASERLIATAGRDEPVPVLRGQDRPAFSPAFGSDGTAIFFHTGGSGDPRSAIEVATSAGSPGGDLGIMTVVDDGARNYHAQPSPDGQFVAFDSDRDGERGVYVANRDGSQVRRVSGPGYAAAPTWAPDGRRLAYIRAEPGNRRVWNLWVQPIDGDRATRITDHAYGQTWAASWFPDNRRVAYTHDDEIIVLDLVTSASKRFASPVKGRAVRTPAVSPDGSKVIFQVFRHGAWLLDLADGSMRCVLTDPTAEEFAWAPDGRRVAFHSRRDGRWGIYMLFRG
jgi:hypothetical protein